jgi:hypothetical protein
MDELRVALLPSRSKMLLLGGVVSSSMLQGDSETECLLEGLVDGAFDDDEPFFLERKLEVAFHMIVALTLNKYIWGF